jgi:hypothetical protein
MNGTTHLWSSSRRTHSHFALEKFRDRMPTVLFLGSVAGLRIDSTRGVFLESFVLSLLFSVLFVGLGIPLIIFRMKRSAGDGQRF